MRGEPTDFWAKLEREEGRVSWQPLLAHCADVAACAEALLRTTILGQRLAVLADLGELHSAQIARLAVLAALHDAGKANLGFQNKAQPRPRFTAGHVGEIIDLLCCVDRDYPERIKLLDALAVRELLQWTGGADEDLLDLLLVTFGHHGRPVRPRQTVNQRCWTPARGLDPFAGIARLLAGTRSWFPMAWEANAPLLPASAAFQHAWAGTLMLADWLGSDSERFFPFVEEGEGDRMELARTRAGRALRDLGLATAPARCQLGSDAPGYRFMGQRFEPRPAQRRLLELGQLGGGSVLVLEAATGSGKTEAALAHYLRLFQAHEVDGLYFALPTRTAATQIYRRVCAAVAAAFPSTEDRPPTVLAVPGYLSVDGTQGQRLAPHQVEWPEEGGSRRSVRGWAAESSKRYLAGAVAVGTIDQVLLSALMVRHAHLRSSALLRHLLVVDEVHASDAYMTRVLEAVLDQHVDAGGHALLMSATLGAAARSRLVAAPGQRSVAVVPDVGEASRVPYPAITLSRRGVADIETLEVGEDSPRKTVRVELASIMERPGAIAARALHAARQGAKVLVIRNTVSGCREVQLEVEQRVGNDHDLLFGCAGQPCPHHSRFARCDRQLLDDAIEAAFGLERPSGGQLAVATQTVEQSLDLDADLLFTDLAPLDVLLQRIGRLHRHRREGRASGFEVASVVVFVPETRDLGVLLDAEGKARSVHGIGGMVYGDLRMVEATWACLEGRHELDLPRENRPLVEAATHPDSLAAVVATGGEAWKRHERYVLGDESADLRLAALNRIDRRKSYVECLFPEGETRRRIPTRLGEEDRVVRFAETLGPFGGSVSELTIPSFQAIGIAPELDTADDLEPCAGGFAFRFGTKSFRYDRLGLHALETA